MLLPNLKPSLDQLDNLSTFETRPVEKVLPFAHAPRVVAVSEPPDGARKRDFGMVLDLIEQAASRVRSVEERSQLVETQLEALSVRAADEVRAADARVQAAEARAQLAEGRAKEAETRADEAERWIARLQDVIERHFPR